MRQIVLLLMFACLPGLAAANGWDALKSPTAIVLMRHALAPGTGDPAGFEIDDRSTQRNLDERGRDQARKIGAALKDRGIAFDAVWTSQWYRCRDTATQMEIGPVTEMPPLNSFFSRRNRAEEQTAATLERVRDHESGRLMLVTHQVNITALTDVFPGSGEIIVTELEGGDLTVTGRILIGP